MDDERLRNPPGPGQPDYFYELLERIRDIRASERRVYLRVREIWRWRRTRARRSGDAGGFPDDPEQTAFCRDRQNGAGADRGAGQRERAQYGAGQLEGWHGSQERCLRGEELSAGRRSHRVEPHRRHVPLWASSIEDLLNLRYDGITQRLDYREHVSLLTRLRNERCRGVLFGA
jgi:hypothetical protein